MKLSKKKKKKTGTYYYVSLHVVLAIYQNDMLRGEGRVRRRSFLDTLPLAR